MSSKLLVDLQRRGVKVTVEGRVVVRAPVGALTPELLEQVRAQHDALLTEIQAGRGRPIAPLPETLARLVQAAVGDHINHPFVGSCGQISNLGTYVLGCAALYAAGIEPDKQLKELWMARQGWLA